MKTLRHYKIESPNGKYDVDSDRFHYLVNILEDNNLDYEYRELVFHTIDCDTKEDVNIRNAKIIVKKGVFTKIMGLYD